MIDIKTDKLKPKVAQKIKSFIAEIIDRYPDNLHSIYVVGSAITEDFNEKTSDINSIFVLNEMDLRFVELIAPLGKRHKKEGIAAPLIMTPDYIRQSLDVFPIEFLNFKIIHETVYGKDILNDIEIDLSDLRYQCEREIKIKLIGLIQGYISSKGDKKIIVENLVNYIEGYIPLFRSIIFLIGKETAVKKYEVLKDLSSHTGINTSIFKKVFDMKRGELKLTRDEIDTVFEEYYKTTEEISKKIDEYQL
jgi:predicted nucleotidyltransferase